MYNEYKSFRLDRWTGYRKSMSTESAMLHSCSEQEAKENAIVTDTGLWGTWSRMLLLRLASGQGRSQHSCKNSRGIVDQRSSDSRFCLYSYIQNSIITSKSIFALMRYPQRDKKTCYFKSCYLIKLNAQSFQCVRRTLRANKKKTDTIYKHIF